MKGMTLLSKENPWEKKGGERIVAISKDSARAEKRFEEVSSNE